MYNQGLSGSFAAGNIDDEQLMELKQMMGSGKYNANSPRISFTSKLSATTSVN